jgi:hypothetical protein
MHRRVGHVGRPDRDFAGRSDDLDRSDTVAERTFVRIVTLAIPGRVAKRGEKAVVGSEVEALSKGSVGAYEKGLFRVLCGSDDGWNRRGFPLGSSFRAVGTVSRCKIELSMRDFSASKIHGK